MSEPLVSVILPTRNRAQILGESIRSVLDQTYARLELIVVDDASADDTRDLVAAFRDPRLRYIVLPESIGTAAARNAGTDIARGEWFAFQDSDDLWLPEKLRKQVACAMIMPPEYGAVYTS